MLDVKIILNSYMEDVLAFKCCGLPDQNLEMHIYNNDDHLVTVSGTFILENEKGRLTCNHLFPPWEQRIQPGDAVAFYCYMDESVWNRYTTLAISDRDGNVYRFPTKQITDHSFPKSSPAGKP